MFAGQFLDRTVVQVPGRGYTRVIGVWGGWEGRRLLVFCDVIGRAYNLFPFVIRFFVGFLECPVEEVWF